SGIGAASYHPGPSQAGELVTQFQSSVMQNGRKFCSISGVDEARAVISREYASAHQVVSMVEGIDGSRELHPEDDPHTLADVDLAIVHGEVGVAENAAIWISESRLIKRVLPFIAQNLAIVIHERDIVATLHDAYARISIAEHGYGVFISAPSKTADIEQSLVIGAHGPRSLSVIVMS